MRKIRYLKENSVRVGRFSDMIGALPFFVFLLTIQTYSATYTVSSPDGKIIAQISHNENGGLSYSVTSGGSGVLNNSNLGITTDKGDFTGGLTFVSNTPAEINETYKLPVGKRSTYSNHANELLLKFSKGQQEMHLIFRAYNEGIAFRYAIPGSGAIGISSENTTFSLAGDNITYWGMSHPNNYGYESALGPTTASRMSMPVLALLADRNHYIFIAQAATYGNYIIPNFQRQNAVLRVSFPMDQTTPVQTTLPFSSPWRFAVISPGTPKTLIESTMPENLNPPSEQALVDASWVKPGRATWDFIAGDKNKPNLWVDACVKLGWEYHLADAGFANQFNVDSAVAYATAKNVGIIGWASASSHSTPDKAEQTMARYAAWGLKGMKIDFFDRNWVTGEAKTNDFEDTQLNLQVRDDICQRAASKKLLLELHGCAITSGERRRWPHLMTVEAVYGMEKSTTNLRSNLTIPYVRNIMGPTSFTIIRSVRDPGSAAHQVATSVIYEAGIMIYAEHHSLLLSSKAFPFLQKVPSTWDDTRFIDGIPSSHSVFARRKGNDWFVGAVTEQARTTVIPLTFLNAQTLYNAEIYRDGSSKTEIIVEKKSVRNTDTLKIALQAAGGCAVYLGGPTRVSHDNAAQESVLSMSNPRNGFTVKRINRGVYRLPRELDGIIKSVSLYDCAGRLIVMEIVSGSTVRLDTGNKTKNAVFIMRVQPLK